MFVADITPGKNHLLKINLAIEMTSFNVIKSDNYIKESTSKGQFTGEPLCQYSSFTVGGQKRAS